MARNRHVDCSIKSSLHLQERRQSFPLPVPSRPGLSKISPSVFPKKDTQESHGFRIFKTLVSPCTSCNLVAII